MFWCEIRTFLIGVIVLVELVGVQNGGWFDGNAGAVDALPLEVAGGGRLAWGVESFLRAKRESGGNSTKNLVSSSITSPGNGGGGGGGGSQKSNGSTAVGPSGSVTVKTVDVKQKTLVIPDRSPANMTNAQITEESNSGEDEDDLATKRPGQGDFDEKAVTRAIIVIAGIAVIVIVYLGVKFALIKRRKVVKRYGRVEASEMDLLDEVEDDDESDEEEELFDINQQRRS